MSEVVYLVPSTHTPILPMPEDVSFVLIFRRPIYKTDTIVQYFIGEYVHVEAMLHKGTLSHSHPVYSTFIGTPFMCKPSLSRLYNNQLYTAYQLNVDANSSIDVSNYLAILAQRAVPYNLKDVMLQVLRPAADTFISDVAEEDPMMLQSVFCSQAMALALRNCLDESTHMRLKADLTLTNSRLITPCELLKLIKPFSKQLDCDFLRDGIIQHYC